MPPSDFYWNRVGEIAEAATQPGQEPPYSLVLDLALTPMSDDEYQGTLAALRQANGGAQ